MRLVPYLNFNGQCAAAFQFYADLLGGTIAEQHTFGSTPMQDGQAMPPEFRDQIMHVRLDVGDNVLMGSDSPWPGFEPPRGVYVSLHLTDPAEAERIFHGLAEGGNVEMPIQETFWAARYGSVVDRFGIPWQVNCDKAE